MRFNAEEISHGAAGDARHPHTIENRDRIYPRSCSMGAEYIIVRIFNQISWEIYFSTFRPSFSTISFHF